jgi:hypothetical protein
MHTHTAAQQAYQSTAYCTPYVAHWKDVAEFLSVEQFVQLLNKHTCFVVAEIESQDTVVILALNIAATARFCM